MLGYGDHFREEIKLLHVDDDKAHAKLTKFFLEEVDQSITVEPVETPSEALRIILAGDVDCVISDYAMPMMDGIQFAENVRQISDVPFIIYTGYGSEEVAEAAFSSGVNDYVRKEEGPFHYSILAKRIRVAVENYRSQILLRNSEERYRRLAENAADILFTLDLEGNITYMSRSIEAATGYRLEDLLGKNVSVFLLPESSRIVKENIRDRVADAEDSPPYTVWMRSMNSEAIPFEFNTSPVYDDDTNLSGLQVIAREVSERLKKETALRESEEKFRNLAEYSPNMILIYGKRRVFFANMKCVENLGYSKDEFYDPGFNLLDLMMPDSVETGRESFKKHMKGEEVPPYECGLLTRDGKKVDVIVSTKLIKYDEGDAILGIFTDITEKKRLEEKIRQYTEELESLVEDKTSELRISAEKYRLLFTNMSEGVAIHELVKNDEGRTVDYVVTDVNPSFEKVLGIRREDAVGQRASKLYGSTPPPYLDIYTRVAETGTPKSFESNFPPMGKHFIISAFSHRRGSFATVFSDITEIIRLREELISTERIAAVGRATSMIAHDLRGPLQIVKNAIYYCRKRPERYMDSLDMIERAMDQSMEMLEELRVKTRESPLMIKDTDLGKLILEVVNEFTVPELTKLETRLGKMPGSLPLDPMKIRRTLKNLIQNAVEASTGGGDITVEAWIREENLNIQVSDTGVGIPDDLKETLFEPFQTTKSGGWGLGLFYCKKAVEAHGGIISVESEAGKGSRFTITIPLKKISGARA